MSEQTPMSAKQAQSFATAIAADLHDTESLQKYLIYCRKHPKHVIQKALNTAKTASKAKIKKSRAALFFYLVKQYAHHTG